MTALWDLLPGLLNSQLAQLPRCKFRIIGLSVQGLLIAKLLLTEVFGLACLPQRFCDFFLAEFNVFVVLHCVVGLVGEADSMNRSLSCRGVQ